MPLPQRSTALRQILDGRPYGSARILEATAACLSAAPPLPFWVTPPGATVLSASSGTHRRRSPGWQTKTSHSALSVENRTALARPFFNTARFAGVMPIRCASSPPAHLSARDHDVHIDDDRHLDHLPQLPAQADNLLLTRNRLAKKRTQDKYQQHHPHDDDGSAANEIDDAWRHSPGE